MSEVGAHHHNVVVERAVGAIVWSARTMLLHAAIYWPENDMPSMNIGLFPLDIFSRACGDHSHVWEWSSYVLDPTLLPMSLSG
eukprot:7878080-Ditylum_brightwellii.AAC.2